MIRIVLVEDHQIVRSGIKTMLEREGDVLVTAEVSNGKEVLPLLENKTEADITLTDLSMPEMDGLTLIEHLQQRYPQIKLIVLSMMDNEKYIYEAFRLGVSGYLLKNTSTEEVLFAIRHVAAGKKMVCAELGMVMLNRACKSFEQRVPLPAASDLTNRELDVLKLIAEGHTNNEIASRIFTSRRTVEGHRQNLIDKTGVKNSAQLIRLACKAGII